MHFTVHSPAWSGSNCQSACDGNFSINECIKKLTIWSAFLQKNAKTQGFRFTSTYVWYTLLHTYLCKSMSPEMFASSFMSLADALILGNWFHCYCASSTRIEKPTVMMIFPPWTFRFTGERWTAASWEAPLFNENIQWQLSISGLLILTMSTT